MFSSGLTQLSRFAKVWKWLLVGERQQMARHTLPSLKGIHRVYKSLLNCFLSSSHFGGSALAPGSVREPRQRPLSPRSTPKLGVSAPQIRRWHVNDLCRYNFAPDLPLRVSRSALLRIDDDHVRNPHVPTVNWDGARGNIKWFFSRTWQLSCRFLSLWITRFVWIGALAGPRRQICRLRNKITLVLASLLRFPVCVRIDYEILF